MIKKFYKVGCFIMLILTLFGLYLLALEPELFARLAVLSGAEVAGMYAIYLLVLLLAAAVYLAVRQRIRKPVLSSNEDAEDIEEHEEPVDESDRIRRESVMKIGKPVLFLLLFSMAVVINFFAVRRIWVFSTVMGEAASYVKEIDHWVEYQCDDLVLNINDRAGYSEELLAAKLDSVDKVDLECVADKYTIVVSDCKAAQHTWETTHGLSNVIYYAYADGDTLYCAGGGLITESIAWAAGE